MHHYFVCIPLGFPNRDLLVLLNTFVLANVIFYIYILNSHFCKLFLYLKACSQILPRSKVSKKLHPNSLPKKIQKPPMEQTKSPTDSPTIWKWSATFTCYHSPRNGCETIVCCSQGYVKETTSSPESKSSDPDPARVYSKRFCGTNCARNAAHTFLSPIMVRHSRTFRCSNTRVFLLGWIRTEKIKIFFIWKIPQWIPFLFRTIRRNLSFLSLFLGQNSSSLLLFFCWWMPLYAMAWQRRPAAR